MSSNAEIRTVNFAQGVDVSSAIVTDDNDTLDLSNNVADTSTGLTYDLAYYRSIKFKYTLRRRTDTTTGLIQRGEIVLVADPDGIGADKWKITQNYDDEGTTPGITFKKSVTGDVVDLQYDSTNLAGANHHAYFSYELESHLV